jgi:hypothetical protein
VTNRTTHATSISSNSILRQHQTKSHQNIVPQIVQSRAPPPPPQQQRHGTARNTTHGSTFESEAVQPLKNPGHGLIKLATEKKGANVIPRPHRHTLARTSKALTHLKNRSHPRALRSRRPAGYHEAAWPSTGVLRVDEGEAVGSRTTATG